MNIKTIAKVALVAVAMFGASAAFAGDNQADWTTTLNVKLALLNKLGADSMHIDVDSAAGIVVLKGMVDKRETKELAETVAKSVTGVKSINNDITLEANMANPNKAGVAAGEAEAEVKDAVLETKIRIALIDKLGSDGFKVGTEAASGVVTLEFDKDMKAMRRDEVTKVVKAVEGVTKVISVDKKG
ncbi:MAG: BON domain-containing protein [Thermoanaerobaculia bacterium]